MPPDEPREGDSLAFGVPLPADPEHLRAIVAEASDHLAQIRHLHGFIRGADHYQRATFRPRAAREDRIRAASLRERATEEIGYAMATRRMSLDLATRHITAEEWALVARAGFEANTAAKAFDEAAEAGASKKVLARKLPALEIMFGPFLAKARAIERIREEALAGLEAPVAAKPMGRPVDDPERNRRIEAWVLPPHNKKPAQVVELMKADYPGITPEVVKSVRRSLYKRRSKGGS